MAPTTAGNIDEDDLRRYLTVFHETYKGTVEEFIPSHARQQLARYRFVRDHSVGYLSTNNGAGYEYLDGLPSLSIERSSARVEDMLFKAPAQVREGPTMFQLRASWNITFQGGTFEGAFPVRLEGRSFVRLIDMRYRALGWERYVLYAELFTDRTVPFWSESNAVARAKDEVLVALFDLQEAQRRSLDLADYLKKFKSRLVLVLGDYSFDGLRRLETIQAVLEELGYNAVLLKEVDVPGEFGYDLQQKAVAVGSVARFVVIDDSAPSGHYVELVLAQQNRWISAVLRLAGSTSSFMTRGVSLSSTVMREYSYDEASVRDVVRQAAAWAEERVKELGRSLASLYPWASQS